jgi:hypothetical protein
MTNMVAAAPNLGTIKCPACKNIIKLTEAMASTLLEQEQAKHQAEMLDVENKLRVEFNAKFQTTVDKSVALRVAKTMEIADSTRKNAEQAFADLEVMKRQLGEAQKAQAASLARERALETKERELDLTIQRRVNSEASQIRDQARNSVAAEYQLQVAEKDQQLSGLQVQIEELRRRAEQGSTQLQGETQEIVLEDTLQATWMEDTISPVAKGVFGGDCLQSVMGPNLRPAGSILFESKRTKVWQDNWLSKLRLDQRNAKADVAVIVTQALPREMVANNQSFMLVEGVWVCQWALLIPFVFVLRRGLIDLASSKIAAAGAETKAELVYAYLSSQLFKQRVQGMLEYVAGMKDLLEKEKRQMQAAWAARDRQIDGLVTSVAGMYGDLSGIAGGGIAQVEGLQVGVVEGKV